MCQSASKYIVVGQAPACGQPASACRTCGLAALGQRLAQQTRPRLGFTDLEEDEALLVWLCRRWYQGMRDRTQIEAELAADMSRDAYAAVLLYLFALLAELPDPETQTEPGWPLLSAHEMRLLDLLGHRRPVASVPGLGGCLRACRHEISRRTGGQAAARQGIARAAWLFHVNEPLEIDYGAGLPGLGHRPIRVARAGRAMPRYGP